MKMDHNIGKICARDGPAAWDGFDFSPCIRFRVLEEIVPLAICVLALLYLAVSVCLESKPAIQLDPDAEDDDDPVRAAEIEVIRTVAAQEARDSALALGFIDATDVAKQNGHASSTITPLEPFFLARHASDRRYNMIQIVAAFLLAGLFVARAALLHQVEGVMAGLAWVSNLSRPFH